MMVVQLYKFIKNHRDTLYTDNWVNFMVYKFYLNKALCTEKIARLWTWVVCYLQGLVKGERCRPTHPCAMFKTSLRWGCQ